MSFFDPRRSKKTNLNIKNINTSAASQILYYHANESIYKNIDNLGPLRLVMPENDSPFLISPKDLRKLMVEKKNVS